MIQEKYNWILRFFFFFRGKKLVSPSDWEVIVKLKWFIQCVSNSRRHNNEHMVHPHWSQKY